MQRRNHENPLRVPVGIHKRGNAFTEHGAIMAATF